MDLHSQGVAPFGKDLKDLRLVRLDLIIEVGLFFFKVLKARTESLNFRHGLLSGLEERLYLVERLLSQMLGDLPDFGLIYEVRFHVLLLSRDIAKDGMKANPKKAWYLLFFVYPSLPALRAEIVDPRANMGDFGAIRFFWGRPHFLTRREKRSRARELGSKTSQEGPA